MKKLPKLILLSYLGPFVLTFAIAMVFLIMQFLWKYVDDLMGKGLEWYVILELLFYASANLVPMALPLAILLSSIMTFGNLGESSELTAMKSAGLSLMKIMRPLIVFVVILSLGAFLFANYLWPVANLKFRSLIFDIQQQKPTLSLKEKSFYDDIPGYSIRVMEKSDDGEEFEDILIYDHTNSHFLYKRDISAKRGKLLQTEDGNYMVFNLENGAIYEEVEPKMVRQGNHPFQKIYFERAQLNFDLSAFKLQRTDVELYRTHYEMLNMSQLAVMEDSLTISYHNRKKDFTENFTRRFLIYRTPLNPDSLAINAKPAWDTLSISQQKRYTETALNHARSSLEYVIGSNDDLKGREEHIARHRLEWHRKLTLPVACMILFFIGAPLGAIIRKGGLGPPIVASTLLFILYYILSISGEKMAKTAVINPFWGMWMSSFILLPVGMFLTYKSNTDSKLFDKDFYIRILRFGRKKTNFAAQK